MTQTTNTDGLNLIKSFEGFRGKAYKLAGESYYTIGYGHSFDNSITASTVWTEAQALEALKKDLAKFEAYVVKYAQKYKMTFNDNQFAALVSYCYNRGPGGLDELLKYSKTVAEVANNIVVYWGSAERYKDGLVRRRKAEKVLFLKPVVTTGWQKVDGKWYYYKAGAKQTGWVLVKEKWYLLGTDGAMLTGWQKDAGKWYYLNEQGDMAIGWKQVKEKWYYLNEKGVMLTGLVNVKGRPYYLEDDGALRVNSTVKIDKDGHLVF